MTPTHARLILAVLAIVTIWGLLPASVPPTRRPVPPGSGDTARFVKVIDRLRAGEDYYTALGTELRSDNYPAKSVFNWRTPAHLYAIAALGLPAASLLLKLLALGAVLGTALVLSRTSVVAAVLGTFAQLGAVATAFQSRAAAIPDLWAGVFIALALCAYFDRVWAAGALLAVAALFVRELSAPVCIVCGLLALRSRRRTETIVWALAALAYAAYFGWHASEVWSHTRSEDLAHTESWLRWNGLTFLLSTVAVNGWFQFVPRWTIVFFVTAALAGAAAREMVPQCRGSLLTYAALFTVAGLPFNYYWGFITAPIWAFAIAFTPQGMTRLLRMAGSRPPA